MTVTLVLGGARSGKSSYAQRAAENAAQKSEGRLLMIATAEPLDAEMKARIAAHQAERGDAWATVEAPLALTDAIRALKARDCVVVDCLTLWVSNLLQHTEDVDQHTEKLLTVLAAHDGDLWLVSNEVGWGIVPDNALARRFRDVCGRLHQRIAAIADHTVLMVAGLPMQVK